MRKNWRALENPRPLASANEQRNHRYAVSTVSIKRKNHREAQEETATDLHRNPRHDSAIRLSRRPDSVALEVSALYSLCRGDFFMEPIARIELATSFLPRMRSATELHRQQLRYEIVTGLGIYCARAHKYNNLLID